ncbi:major capsid protein [Alloalcanivorax xenomutans]|uniref:major capsid protein n=1 Tax=Alloalcanivorax xenomutans TaxID=1094342 RepID=UPI003D9B9530
MASTLLSDVIIPEVYSDYQAENSPEKTAFFQSGVAVRNPMLDQKANSGGDMLNVPFWKDLDASAEPNYSTDNPADLATPQKVVADKQIARMAYLNQGYSSADLSGEIAGSDPIQRVRNRFGTYWMRQWQRRLIPALNGVLADNVANDGGDMVEDIAIEDGNNATDANLFSRTAFTGAAFTLGDMFESTSAIAVHSVVYKRMVDNNDVEFIPDSEGNLTIPTFLGRRIIVDDGMPVVAGATSGFKYTSVLFGEGAVGYGEGTPKMPVELQREANQGNGGGVETLWERKSWLIHPFGFAWQEASVAGESPTWAELATAANWNRVVARKNVPLAFLTTNG